MWHKPPLAVIVCYRAFIFYKMELENIINSVIKINKAELREKIKNWEELRFKVKSNEEYDLILKQIKLGEAILNAL